MRNLFYQLSTTGVDVGGRTSGRNQVQIDGSPIGVGSRGSYASPMGAVQEFTVQQNSIDAESGFSVGGVMYVGMKAGTNEYHGSAYYFGRNAALNAVSNAFTRAQRSAQPLLRRHVRRLHALQPAVHVLYVREVEQPPALHARDHAANRP